MGSHDLHLDGVLSGAQHEEIEQICARFEGAWRTGEPPKLEAFLEEVRDAERGTLLAVLLQVELSYCDVEGQSPSPEEYYARFPEHAERIAEVFERARLVQTGSSRDVSLSETQSPSDGGPIPQQAAAETVPPRMGRYLVRRKIGSGGFGTVWLADDEELGRQVAIKVPRQNRLSSEASVSGFLREARMAAALKHPALVTIHDLGRLDDGGCFVVMEYIEGRSLADEMKAGPPGVARAVRLIEEVAEAVHYAHKQGLIHRDIKPANILLDRTGQPHVVDFGLAIHEQQQPFRRGESSGTPAYMAPEQIRGESHRLDGRTDVWSLGVVLYEMLVGRSPFAGQTSSELFEEIECRDPKPPRQVDDAVPAELERICLKCLSKRMTERYLTAADLAADLKHFRERLTPLPRAAQLQTGSGTLGEGALLSVLPHPQARTAGQVEDGPLGHAIRQSAPPKIMPKGLRSFDAHDADFFLQLLPGPTDREGLPESLRFWKTRIEQTDADATFAVGLIYGPSGCGKSSLVKAGLLPRLAPRVRPVYLEATADDTESRLLKGLRKQCPGLAGTGLVDCVAELRGGRGLAGGEKLLIVLDQFEQWLHAHRDPDAADLVLALRQCDGTHVQCLVLVRDDFWMAASRFMRALEIRLVEGENSAAVDLFDLRHARRVLTLSAGRTGAWPTVQRKMAPTKNVQGAATVPFGIPQRRATMTSSPSKPWPSWPTTARSSRCGWPCLPIW